MIKKGLVIVAVAVLSLGAEYFILFEWLGFEFGRSIQNKDIALPLPYEVERSFREAANDTFFYDTGIIVKVDTSKVYKDTVIEAKATPARLVKSSDGIEYKVVIIDNCEYLKTPSGEVTHKGNCPNHRNNNNQSN